MKQTLLLLFLFFFCSAVYSQSNQWTWMKGDNFIPQFPIYGTKGIAASTNKPGARQSAVSWTDTSGNLWLFGGSSYAGTLNDLWKYVPSTEQWTWISGDNITNQIGIYGTQGTSASANKPGARQFAVNWTDASGNLWLYGGYGYADSAVSRDGYLNDLWKYDALTGQWTWVSGDTVINQIGIYGTQGTASTTTKPGARQSAVSWTDASGNLWLYGGYGYANSGTSGTGFLSDLWKYAPSTGQWTWISGDNNFSSPVVYGTKGIPAPTNKPGARQNAVSWTDASGNFWLHGGFGYANVLGFLNDLWKYTPSTGQWTWMSGDNSTDQPGVYGTQGTAATANKPGARRYAISWTDTSGNLWLFGGNGYVTSSPADLNDLWKYVLSTGQWTWMSGDNTSHQPGVYGTKNMSDYANKPGARHGAISWMDASGNMWLSGGYGYTVNAVGNLNDLWKYVSLTGQWTWISGDKDIGSSLIYGTKGTADSANKPGARNNAVSWRDASGNLWLLGGYGFSSNGSGDLNDLWKYTTSTRQWTWISGDNTVNSPGVYGVQGLSASTNIPGGRQSAVSWTDASGNIWLFGGYGYGVNGNGYFNDLWKYTPSTGRWVWISGDSTVNTAGIYGTKGIAASTNKPGARQSAVSWTDTSGNLWLFGGSGYAASVSGVLNDLWKYTPLTGNWVWVSGDSTISTSGIYATRGITNATTKPGARNSAVSWTDTSGNLWLFGGNGYAASNSGHLNDLWKYTLSSRQWTWISGDSSINQQGFYGAQGTASSSNFPGARGVGVSWVDASGNMWLFGGNGYTASSGGNLNDLWKYAPSTGQWTWVNGDSTTNQAGVYGTQGIAASTNKPGAKYYAVSWVDASGDLWLFGGSGNSSNGVGTLNDLWKYSIYTASLPVKFLSFTAKMQQQTVSLKWTTAQEQNSRYFIVERSADGSIFGSIGKVAATGTSSFETNYSFIDITPLQSTAFYRLKQLDGNGKFLYSTIVKVAIVEAAHFDVIQNPVQSTLQINVQLPSAHKLTLQVRDASGHLLMNEERLASKGSSVYSLSVDHLAKGIYFLNMQTESLTNTKTFIKQ